MAAAVDYVDRFRCQSGLVSWDEVDLSACTVSPQLARILHVAALLEADTAITVRQGTSLGLDRSADLAAFLPQWGLEEAEHCRVFRFILDHQDYEPPEPSPKSIALRRRALAHIPARVFARLPQTAFLFCVLGAASEYVATVIYSELAKQADSAPLARLLRSISRQEGRHFAFFLAASRQRGQQMTASNGRLARRVLTSIWEPIGVPTLGKAAWNELFVDWLKDDHFRTRVEMMDRVVDSIPHLGGARLMSRFLEDLPSL
jgi:hypothetical protein